MVVEVVWFDAGFVLCTYRVNKVLLGSHGGRHIEKQREYFLKEKFLRVGAMFQLFCVAKLTVLV